MYKIIGSDGKEYGPVDAATLRQWLGQGRVNPSTQVKGASEPDWKPLASYPEFNAALPAAAPPPAFLPSGSARTSRLAVTSLVLGVLGIFSCGGTALVGLILGIMGLNRIKKSQGQLSGSGLAIAGIVVSAIFLLMLPIYAALLLPALAKAKAKAQGIQCMNNGRQIALGIIMYAEGNTNLLPQAATWCDDALTQLSAAKVFLCPAGDATDRCHYAYNANLSGLDSTQIRNPATTVLAFEADGGWNRSGGPELLPTPPRHSKGVVIIFADGHVETLTADRLDQLNWQP
jgi:prepilin-type processing-associated H-X9-DG protein